MVDATPAGVYDGLNERITVSLKHCLNRLDELVELEDGWYGGCDAPNQLSLDNARRFLTLETWGSLSYPNIGPALDGGVMLEWDIDHLIFLNSGGVEYYYEVIWTSTLLNRLIEVSQEEFDEDYETWCKVILGCLKAGDA